MLCGYCNVRKKQRGYLSAYVEPPVMLCGYCNRNKRGKQPPLLLG